MASLQASNLLLSSSCCSSRTRASISVPKLPKILVSDPKRPKNLIEELGFDSHGFTKTIPLTQTRLVNSRTEEEKKSESFVSIERLKLYAILEEVTDRIEMHKNIGEQRNNWNTLMLNSINFITLTAATMAGVATINGGYSLLALKLSSTVLLSSATAMLTIMNKIQPSQLVEEQRNATRLFTQLKSKIETVLAIGKVREDDAKDAMRRVLALDRAYPLPLIGKMLEKFPKEFKPATWWPNKSQTEPKAQKGKELNDPNGWNKELETEMRAVTDVVKMRDMEDYKRLGNIALKLNKTLAVCGPVLTGISAVSSGFIGSSSWATVLAMSSASLATVVNTLEHGCQVGMLFEMYRNSAGFFSQLEESIGSMISESEMERRENGDVFEVKVATKLGRSLSELRDLASKSGFSWVDGHPVDEFASKLF